MPNDPEVSRERVALLLQRMTFDDWKEHQSLGDVHVMESSGVDEEIAYWERERAEGMTLTRTDVGTLWQRNSARVLVLVTPQLGAVLRKGPAVAAIERSPAKKAPRHQQRSLTNRSLDFVRHGALSMALA